MGSINQDRVKEWTTALRSGQYQQIDSTLVKVFDEADPDSTVGYCCMGVVSKLAGCTVHLVDRAEDHEDGPVVSWEAYMSDGHDLPATRVHQWLGLIEGDENLPRLASEEDIGIDWPNDPGYEVRQPPLGTDRRVMDWTCAGLNDDVKLTFAQIADVIDYFGIKEKD